MFESIKNMNSMAFYVLSMICLFASNYARSLNGVYFTLLILGLVFFAIGIGKRLLRK